MKGWYRHVWRLQLCCILLYSCYHHANFYRIYIIIKKEARFHVATNPIERAIDIIKFFILLLQLVISYILILEELFVQNKVLWLQYSILANLPYRNIHGGFIRIQGSKLIAPYPNQWCSESCWRFHFIPFDRRITPNVAAELALVYWPSKDEDGMMDDCWVALYFFSWSVAGWFGGRNSASTRSAQSDKWNAIRAI